MCVFVQSSYIKVEHVIKYIKLDHFGLHNNLSDMVWYGHFTGDLLCFFVFSTGSHVKVKKVGNQVQQKPFSPKENTIH